MHAPAHVRILEEVPLPPPGLAEGKPVAEALKARQTIREISERALSLPQLSNLLWAACGVNRARGPFGTPGLTAASASNSQEVQLFVLLDRGAFLYQPRGHRLEPIVGKDLRELAISSGQRPHVSMNAPVQLVYVADVDRLVHTSGFQEPGLHDPETQKAYYFVDTGLIAGNVYVFAAAEGLAAWFHNCDRERLHQELRLRVDQRVLFAQSVGYPLP